MSLLCFVEVGKGILVSLATLARMKSTPEDGWLDSHCSPSIVIMVRQIVNSEAFQDRSFIFLLHVL